MNALYLDIGNTFIKLAQWNNSKWEILFTGKLSRFGELLSYLNSDNGAEKILLSSVRKDLTEKLTQELRQKSIISYSSKDIPLHLLDYKTADTLGLDRFLVCFAAWKKSGKQNVIVVDAGSACTIDLMTSDGIFRGGIIMPGLEIIKESMEKRLPELPTVTFNIPENWPGKSTTECMEWGVNGAFVQTINGFIERYKKKIADPYVYLTGGNAKHLMEWLKDNELRYCKNLIWDGLQAFAELVNKK